jgi:hypothetical protein
MRWRRDIPREGSVSSMSMWPCSRLILAGGDIARVLCVCYSWLIWIRRLISRSVYSTLAWKRCWALGVGGKWSNSSQLLTIGASVVEDRWVVVRERGSMTRVKLITTLLK